MGARDGWRGIQHQADVRMLRAPSFPPSTGLQWLPYRISTYKSIFYYPIVYMLRQGDKFTFTPRSCTVDMVMQNVCLSYVMARRRFYFHHIAGIHAPAVNSNMASCVNVSKKNFHAAKYASWIPLGHRENNGLE
jgi:hypothetical protein